MRTNIKTVLIAAALTTFAAGVFLTGCSGKKTDRKEEIKNEMSEAMKDSAGDLNADIDLDKLNESVESIKNLDLGGGGTNDAASPEAEEIAEETAGDSAGEPEGEKTVYSYADVYRAGNDITVIPNGGLSGSTELFPGKDLNGFLDYVDSTVLEKGRFINRDVFYGVLATMLVDKDFSAGKDTIEKNMIMALAMGNNFHDLNIKINDCVLDANNAAEYHYHITAVGGRDDTWLINYGEKTVYFNDGKTQYFSDMFKDEYLAVWLMAIDDYYGL